MTKRWKQKGEGKKGRKEASFICFVGEMRVHIGRDRRGKEITLHPKKPICQFFCVRGDGKLRSTDTSKVCPCPTRSNTDTHQTLHGMCQNTTPEVSYYFFKKFFLDTKHWTLGDTHVHLDTHETHYKDTMIKGKQYRFMHINLPSSKL